MKRILLISVLCFSACVAANAAEGQDISKTIEAVVIENLRATEAEDMEAMMETIHTGSPGYLVTKQRMSKLFQEYDIDYDLVWFRFIGIDGKYAVGRTKQKTKKLSGPAFRNNVLDMIQVFKKENGRWKFWNQLILEATYIE